LVAAGRTTVALESTGSYWQPLFVLLQQYNLAPILVNGKFTKNVKGRKTDVMDCQWIQKLHTMGMLEGSFIPDLFTEKVRQYYRHRQTLVDNAASYINKMQKALRLINIRLDSVLRDVMGRSGTDIIEAILKGERAAKVLASPAQP
jgi:transposase